MSYSRSTNTRDSWINYCKLNAELINSLNLYDWAFETEENFRQFATIGAIEKSKVEKINFNQLHAEIFWQLFDFIQNYFDMDSSTFDEFEQARAKKII